MRKYDKYKNTNIEWIGEIPEHWDIKRVKHVAEVVTGTTPPRSNKDNYSGEGYLWVKPDNLEDLNTIFETKERISSMGIEKARLVPKGSVLVCCIGTIGKMGIAGKELTTNQQINSICFNNMVSPSFGKYMLFSSRPELEASSQKVVVSILNKTKQSNIKVPIPPLSEQIQISSYLDNKTSLIDKLKN
jgi:type I restriction enzyme S subunit